jgi:hypothetical protein
MTTTNNSKSYLILAILSYLLDDVHFLILHRIVYIYIMFVYIKMVVFLYLFSVICSSSKYINIYTFLKLRER